MNHIYRTIYNHALGAWVAVAETVKSYSKAGRIAGSTKHGLVFDFPLKALTLAVLLSLGEFSGQAFARDTVYFNDYTDAGCVTLFDTNNKVQSVSDTSLCGITDKDTQVGRALFYNVADYKTSNSLTLGGELYVNSGRLGLGGANKNKIAIGDATTLANQTSNGNNTIAIGAQIAASGNNAVAVGNQAATSGNNAVAIGKSATATVANALAIGNRPTAQGERAIAIGHRASAYGNVSVAIGQFAVAGVAGTPGVNSGSTALGSKAYATGDQSLALGADTRASGHASIAIGGDDLDVVSTTSAATNYNTLTGNSFPSGYLNTEAGLAAIAVGVQTTATGDLSTAFGTRTEATGHFSSAFGVRAQATGKGAVAMGPNAKASGSQSLASGISSVASGADSIAIGTEAQAKGTQSISIGYKNVVSGANSGAIGDPSIINGTDSYSVGNDNAIGSTSSDIFILGNETRIGGTLNTATGVVTDTTAHTEVIALGNNITTVADHSVFLGNDSAYVADNGTRTQGIDNTYTSDDSVLDNTTLNFAGGDQVVGVVSVGNATQTRRIQNVAPGEISATSTDAINGSQLYSVAKELDRENYFHVNKGTSAIAWSSLTAAQKTNLDDVDGTGAATGINATTAGVNARATGKRAVGIGYDARATGEDSYALGYASRARGENSIALGTGSAAGAATGTAASKEETIAIGNNTKAYAQQAISIGSDIQTSGAYGIAIGSNTSKRSVNSKGYAGVAIGSGGANEGASANGESAVAIGGGNSASSGLDGAVAGGDNSVALGSGSSATLDNTVALGSQSVSSRAALSTPTTSGNQITGIGAGGASKTVYAHSSADTTAKNAVIATVKGNLGAVSVGSGTATRQIINVAAGSEDTDAVNVAQLRAVANIAAAADRNTFFHTNNTGSAVAYDATETNEGLVDATAGAFGENSLAAGIKAHAVGLNATAISKNSRAYSNNSVAIGLNAQAGGDATDVLVGQRATAVGVVSKATGSDSAAFGSYANASGVNSVAFGNAAISTGTVGKIGTYDGYSTAVGSVANATGQYSTAIGYHADATHNSAVAIGYNAQATNTDAIAIGGTYTGGQAAKASGARSIAMGRLAATGTAADNAIALGFNAQTNLANAVALGSNSRATRGASTAANTQAGHGGYNAATGAWGDSGAIDTTRSNLAAVSVGNVTHNTDGTVDTTVTTNKLRQITGVAAGTNNADAVNVAQLKAVAAVAQTASAGWNIGGNDGTAGTSTTGTIGAVAATKQVTFVSGDSNNNTKVAVTQASGQSTVTITTAKSPMQYTSTNNADGSNTANDNQFTATNQVTLVGSGTGQVTVNNVANAELSTTSKQAVNGSQLYAVGSSTASALGGTSSFNPTTGKVTAGLSVGGNNYTNVQDALNQLNTTASAHSIVAAGTNIVDVTSSTTGGQTTYTVNAKGTTVSGTGAVSVVGTPNTTTNVTDYAVSVATDGKTITTNSSNQLAAVTGDIAENTNGTVGAGTSPNALTTASDVASAINHAGWNIQGNGTTEDLVTAGNTVNFENGNATTAVVSSDGVTTTVTYNVKVDNSTIRVNGFGQLEADTTAIATATNLTYGSNGANDKQVTLANGLDFVNTTNIAASVKANGVVQHTLNDDITVDSVTLNDAVDIGANPTSTKAVSSEDVNTYVSARTFRLTADDGNTATQKLDNAITVAGGKNITTSVTGTTLKVALDNNIDLGASGSVTTGKTTVNNNGITITGGPSVTTTGVDAGGKTITNVAPGVNGTDAVNVDQLNAATGGVVNNINKLSGEIAQVRADANAGTASAIAAASMAQPHKPGGKTVGIGVGTYRGESAIAIGASVISDNGKWILKGAINTNSRGHTGAGASVNFHW